jgi:antitoxin (DNA-binding transcriptional repressor) of toxin-antitoxin stability system
MKKYSIHKAKTELSKLLKLALDGEEVVIANREEPIVRLEVIKPKKRKIGIFADQGWIAGDFDAPLDEFEDYR